MKSWVGWPVANGLPTVVVIHQLQVERGTGKVCRSETDVLPLCNATNHYSHTLRVDKSHTRHESQRQTGWAGSSGTVIWSRRRRRLDGRCQASTVDDPMDMAQTAWMEEWPSPCRRDKPLYSAAGDRRRRNAFIPIRPSSSHENDLRGPYHAARLPPPSCRPDPR